MDGWALSISMFGFAIAAIVIFIGVQLMYSTPRWAGTCYETKLEWNNNQKYPRQNLVCAKRVPFTATAAINLQR